MTTSNLTAFNGTTANAFEEDTNTPTLPTATAAPTPNVTQTSDASFLAADPRLLAASLIGAIETIRPGTTEQVLSAAFDATVSVISTVANKGYNAVNDLLTGVTTAKPVIENEIQI